MKLRTIGLISTLVLGFLAGPLRTEAQKGGKVYRVGFLRFSCSSLTTYPPYIAFRQGLRELGYVEGQNLVIEHRCADRMRKRRPVLAAELVRLKVDVIVTHGAPGLIRAVQGATRTIPIVLISIRDDPVKRGYVDSLARPGGNITGLTSLDTELHQKRLELLKEAFPRISRVAVLWSRGHQKRRIKEVKAAGRALGIQIQSAVIGRRPSTFDSAFSAILHADRAQPRESPRGLLVTPSSFVNANQALIIEFTAKRRLPTIYARSRFVDAGGLMSYGVDFQRLYRRIATYVDKILKGAKPGDLPIERPTKFDFVINLKTAKALGLTIPPEVLLQATRVIK